MLNSSCKYQNGKGASVIVCGLGSMGRRRVRLLQSIWPEADITGVDTRQDRLDDAMTQSGIQVEVSYESALKKTKAIAVFVCTSPLTHSQLVCQALEKGAHVFSEINLTSDGYERIKKAALKHKRLAFLSATALYRKEMQWIDRQVCDAGKKVSYRYHVGQYLPDWHPWESYQDFFVVDKKSNACREIMAIELPWIIRSFGQVNNFHKISASVSSLELEYPDTIHLIFEHESGAVGNISVDCVSKKAVRHLEIYSDQLYLSWSGTPDSLCRYSLSEKQLKTVQVYDHVAQESQYADFIVENPYVEEIEHFLHLIEGNENLPILYGYEQDQQILNLIDAIETRSTMHGADSI